MSNINKCRLCLRNCNNKIEIFKHDFPKMIEILAGVKVNPEDDFPKHSCLECAKNVKSALQMRKLIIRSHKILLEEFLAKCRRENIKELNNLATYVSNTDNNKTTRKSLRIIQRKDNYLKNNKKGVAITTETEINENYGSDSQDDRESNEDAGLDRCSDSEWTLPKPDDDELQPSLTSKASNQANKEVLFLKKHLKPTPKPPSRIIVRIKKKQKPKTPPVRVTCQICSKEVQSHWLQKHMETHEYNPVTCEVCGLVSKSPTALRHHVFYYHKSTAHEHMCDQCAKSFRSTYRLNLHKKKEHGGTKDFECTTCGKKFFERMHLKRHVDKTHKNIRAFECNFCGKRFKSKNHIKIHERIHSNETPYICKMCGETFKMKITLRTHLKNVHNLKEEQTVFCNVCNRGFASDVALKAHLNSRIHETMKCQHCSEMFTTDYMVNHLRDVHQIMNGDDGNAV